MAGGTTQGKRGGIGGGGVYRGVIGGGGVSDKQLLWLEEQLKVNRAEGGGG